MRTVVMVIALLLAGGAASAQSQDSKPKQEKEKEKAAAPRKPAPTYTDEDLKRAREGGGGNVTFLPGRPDEPAESTSAGDESKSEERPRTEADSWRERAQEHRQAVTAAEASVKGIEERLGELTNDMSQNPGDLFDPSRLQKREAEKQKLIPELEAAKAELAAAKKALADFEQEARSAGIPPGRLQP